SSFSARGVGRVAGLCATKAPGLRNGIGTLISKRDPRSVVVCGMTVMMSRSLSPQGPLRTRAGRTFSIMPRSTSQTSPRLGAFFILVEQVESHARSVRDVFVGERLAVDLGGSRLLLAGGVERVPQGLLDEKSERLAFAPGEFFGLPQQSRVNINSGLHC